MEFSAITANGQPLAVIGNIMANVTAEAQHSLYIAGDINSDGILGFDQPLSQRSICCKSRKCFRGNILMHAIFAVFIYFFYTCPI